MATKTGIRVCVVGLGFGSAFVPIYQRHPGVERVGICEVDGARLDKAGTDFGIDARFNTLEQVLEDPQWDAVHLLTPVPFHVEQTLAVLEAGKHCACAVPMATDCDDLRRIVEARNRANRNYMMMETTVYTREFLFAQELRDGGKLGPITFLRGTYFQDLEADYPLYWYAQPPMHYATHAVGPVLAMAGTRAEKVACFGSGRLRPELQQPGGNTFPLQTAIFRLAGTEIAAEVTRSWFQTAHGYTEAFSVYGEQQGFEWQQLEDEDPVVYTMDPVPTGIRWHDAPGTRVKVPYRPDLVPKEIAEFANGGHGGSHPHLVHEFVSSITEGRRSRIDAVTAADWTAPGICANLSSLKDGAMETIPSFEE